LLQKKPSEREGFFAAKHAAFSAPAYSIPDVTRWLLKPAFLFLVARFLFGVIINEKQETSNKKQPVTAGA